MQTLRRMQVGFTTLRELVAMRLPTRKAALAILLDMTTHPGAPSFVRLSSAC